MYLLACLCLHTQMPMHIILTYKHTYAHKHTHPLTITQTFMHWPSSCYFHLAACMEMGPTHRSSLQPHIHLLQHCYQHCHASKGQGLRPTVGHRREWRWVNEWRHYGCICCTALLLRLCAHFIVRTVRVHLIVHRVWGQSSWCIAACTDPPYPWLEGRTDSANTRAGQCTELVLSSLQLLVTHMCPSYMRQRYGCECIRSWAEP